MLQDVIARVKHRGDVNRSRWNPADMPALNGWPLRNYRWWRQQTNYRGPDNLCHFVRVALFWAPLRWLVQPVQRLGNATVTMVLVVLIALMIIALQLAILVQQGASTLLIGDAVIVGGVLAAWALVFLAKRYKRQLGSAGDWFIEAHPARIPWLRPWVAIPVALVALAPFSEAALSLVIIMAFVFGCFLILSGSAWLSHELSVRQRHRQEHLQKEVFLRTLFGMQHPDKVGNERAYLAWRERYIQWRLVQFQRGSWSSALMRYEDITPSMLMSRSTLPWRAMGMHTAADSIIRQREKQRTVYKPRRPSRAKKASVAVGQFFALVWAFIVINKWKICPIIQLPDESAH
jgi:hypothetical protein